MKNMRPLLLALIFTAPAAALTPETGGFLKLIGIDPLAWEVVELSSDSVKSRSGDIFTLDSVAAGRDETAVRSFLVTRSFLHAFREDPGTQFPDNALYDLKYLTIDEQRYIARTLMKDPAKPKAKPAAAKRAAPPR